MRNLIAALVATVVLSISSPVLAGELVIGNNGDATNAFVIALVVAVVLMTISNFLFFVRGLVATAALATFAFAFAATATLAAAAALAAAVAFATLAAAALATLATAIVATLAAAFADVDVDNKKVYWIASGVFYLFAAVSAVLFFAL